MVGACAFAAPGPPPAPAGAAVCPRPRAPPRTAGCTALAPPRGRPRAPRAGAARRPAGALVAAAAGAAAAVERRAPGVPRAKPPATRFDDAVEVEAEVAPGLRVKALEASLEWQERLVEEAVEALEQEDLEVDPYGAALWPAAQVLAQAAVAQVQALARARAGGPPPRVLELGAGCGLASLAAAAAGAEVLATDFRELPLELLAESARRQGLGPRLRTGLFDVCDAAAPLPEADVVMASDLLYDPGTAAAVARRAAEARARGSAVLVGDIGRPGREAFVEVLRGLRPGEPVDFSACRGAAAVRHAAGAAGAPSGGPPGGRPRDTAVEVLELPPGPATAAVRPEAPCVLWRPAGHAHVL